MDYQAKYNKKFVSNLSKGITLMELLIVIAIFSILASFSFSAYTSFGAKNNLEVATGSLVEALRFAQTNAQAVNGDSKWGVWATTTQIVVFKGTNYLSRDTAFDQSLNLPRETTASGLSEIIFEKMTGATLTTGTTTITNPSGNKNININAKGIITY
jgi:prepilin-type N-terminal cleavage/methylation domain-containing protein